METRIELSAHEVVRLVLTVPMRNGNDSVQSEMNTKLGGSYRTYEEWKPQKMR